MSLRTINLNLLPALHALLTEKSVTGAAGTLGLSQPATSDILARLRVTFNDKLLVRVGQRTSLTPRAIELIEPTRLLCAQLALFFSPPTFDPQSSTRRFVVATSDFGALLVAGNWIDRLARLAPGVILRFEGIDLSLPLRLADRQIDFVILPEPLLRDLPPQPLEQLPLSHVELGADAPVILFRAGHPLDRGEALSRDDIARYQLFTYHPNLNEIERRHGNWAPKKFGLTPNVEIGEMAIMPFLLLDNDAIALIPERMARVFMQNLPVRYASVNFAPAPLPIALAWSKVQEDDLGHQWFRREIVRSA